MAGNSMVSRVIDRLDQINARSMRVLMGYLMDNRFAKINLSEPKVYLMFEEAIYQRLHGADGDDFGDRCGEDIDDSYQRWGDTTYPFFLEEFQEIICELLDNGFYVNEGLIFAFFAHSRSDLVKQRLEEACKSQGGPLTETVFYSWEEACGALEALCVAERLCCADRKYPKEVQKEIKDLKVSGSLSSKYRNWTKEYKMLPLKEKAFEILQKRWQGDPKPSQNSIAIEIIEELHKIERSFAGGEGNRTVHKWIKEWIPLFLEEGAYWQLIAIEDGRDLKDVARDYFLTKTGRGTLGN